MPPLAKALLANFFLDLTSGFLVVAMVWAVLSLLHAVLGVIIVREVIAGLLVIAASVALLRRILNDDRELAQTRIET
jgi:hypothetical protein